MTDSEQKSGGLPTVVWRKIDGNYYNLVVESDKETHVHNPEDVYGDYREWDELVRRSDVKNLIQDKIEKLHNLNTQFQEEHRDIPYPVKENIDQIKKDLLEEIR